MYFKTRAQAGELLADQLVQYRYEDCAVVALSVEAVAAAEPIATRLHAVLGLFLSESIDIPGENVTVGNVNQSGEFNFDPLLSEDQQQDYYGEFHGYIDDQKREKFQKINRLIGEGGAINPNLLREHVVILVSDGMKVPEQLDSAAEFLKPIHYKRLIVAIPVASVPVVDRMHILADEIHCLSVTDNFIETDHYYEADTKLTREQAIQKINNIILNWR